VRRLSDEQLFDSIKKGVPGTDMPPCALPDEQIRRMAAFVRSLSQPAIASVVKGDVEAGREIFFKKGGCVSCHMIRSQGGFPGPDLSDIGAPGSPYWRMCQRLAVGTEVQAPDGRSSRIHVEDTWNTEILPELAPLASDIIIKKRRWSAFYDTELDARLQRLGARYLVITGCTTSMCIESTIRDAAFRDFICLLPADCTGQPARPDSTYSGHEASLNIIELSFGWVSSSDSIGRAFEAAGASSTATDLRAPAPRGGGR